MDKENTIYIYIHTHTHTHTLTYIHTHIHIHTLKYYSTIKKYEILDFPGGAVVQNPPANAGDTGSSPGPGRSHMLRSN